MSNEPLYWILSTIAQVNAALVAFVGFLVVSVLNRLSSKMEQLEDICIQVVNMNVSVFTRQLETHKMLTLFPARNETYFRSMPAGQFMDHLIQIHGKETANLSFVTLPTQHWIALRVRALHLRRSLVGYICSNVTILLLSLGSIPVVPSLVSLPGLFLVLIVVSLFVALSTAIMVYQTVSGPIS